MNLDKERTQHTSKEPGNIFITGLYRSGTTLAEKLLHTHNSICVGSQPFPHLYFSVKNAFYAERGMTRRYPLEHLFLESYTPEELDLFLERYTLSEEDLDQIFDSIASNGSGSLTPEIARYRRHVCPGKFIDVFNQMNKCVGLVYPKCCSQAEKTKS